MIKKCVYNSFVAFNELYLIQYPYLLTIHHKCLHLLRLLDPYDLELYVKQIHNILIGLEKRQQLKLHLRMGY